MASAACVVDGCHLGVQNLVGPCAGTGRALAPLAVAAARHLGHAATSAGGVLVATLVDPGGPLRGTPSLSEELLRPASCRPREAPPWRAAPPVRC